MKGEAITHHRSMKASVSVSVARRRMVQKMMLRQPSTMPWEQAGCRPKRTHPRPRPTVLHHTLAMPKAMMKLPIRLVTVTERSNQQLITVEATNNQNQPSARIQRAMTKSMAQTKKMTRRILWAATHHPMIPKTIPPAVILIQRRRNVPHAPKKSIIHPTPPILPVSKDTTHPCPWYHHPPHP